MPLDGRSPEALTSPGLSEPPPAAPAAGVPGDVSPSPGLSHLVVPGSEEERPSQRSPRSLAGQQGLPCSPRTHTHTHRVSAAGCSLESSPASPNLDQGLQGQAGERTRLQGSDWKSIRGGQARSCPPQTRHRRPRSRPRPTFCEDPRCRRGGGASGPTTGGRETPSSSPPRCGLRRQRPRVFGGQRGWRGEDFTEVPSRPSSVASLGAGRGGGSPPPPAGSEPACMDVPGSGTFSCSTAGQNCPGRGWSRSDQGCELRAARLRGHRAHAQQTVAPGRGIPRWPPAGPRLRTPGFRGSSPRTGQGEGRSPPPAVATGPRDRKQEVARGRVDTVATRLPPCTRTHASIPVPSPLTRQWKVSPKATRPALGVTLSHADSPALGTDGSSVPKLEVLLPRGHRLLQGNELTGLP